MELYFGDIHNHCGITYGFGGLENALKNAKSHLDFVAITGHAFWSDLPKRDDRTAFLVDFHERGFQKLRDHFPEIKNTINSFNTPEDFTTFFSYEMHSSKYGDHHLVSGDENIPLVYGDSPSLWFDKIKNFKDTIILPHHIAYTPNYRGISWDDFDSEICKVVEVCSKHGVSMSDKHEVSYYHNMGCRDEHNSVYEGLRQDKIFGFVGSTDHHAGYPGSYGDCLLACLATSNTRHDIIDAIKNRRTYALTHDRIKCDFSVNGNGFGSVVKNDTKTKTLSYNIEATDFIDKIIVFKNLVPIHIINGETLCDVNQNGEYKVRVECGWGNIAGLYDWNIDVKTEKGEIVAIEKSFRGCSILAPSPDLVADDSVNQIDNHIEIHSPTTLYGKLQTAKNPTTTSPATSAFTMTIKGDLNTKITVNINGKTISQTISALISHSFSQPMFSSNSQSFKVHLACPHSQYSISNTFTDIEENPCFYHLEVKQRNNSQAFVSPVFFQ